LWIDGLLPKRQTIGSIRKHYFYHEHFDVLAFLDTEGQLAGYYSDITTHLQKVADGYAITDLFLDIWLTPEGRLHELDVDEFAEAIAKDLVPPGLQSIAWNTMERLRLEVQAGVYPQKYLG
jgi:predicted RNA-binding protein associated with RNAse of E/G family